MSYLGTAALVAAISNLALTLFILTRGLKPVLNRVYTMWGVAVITWNVATYFLIQVHNPADALLWVRILFAGVICMPIANLHFSLLIAKVSIGRWLVAAYVFHGLLLVSLFSGYFISGVRDLHFAYYAIAGPCFRPFLAFYVASTTTTMVMLYRRQRNLPSLHRIRLRCLIAATGILIVFGTNDLLPVLGVDFYPILNTPIYPLGNIAAIFYGIIVGYSALQYELLDVHVALSHLIAHAVRILFLFLINLGLLLILIACHPASFKTFSFFGVLAVLLASSLIASVAFPRIFGGGGEKIERILLGDHFEYHDKVRNFINSMQWYSDTNLLLSDLHDLLLKTIGLERYQIILLDETSRVYSLFRSYPEEAARTFPDMHSQSPIFQFFKTTKTEYMTFNLTYSAPASAQLEREAGEQMKSFQAEFCFPFVFEEEPFGLLLLGNKTNNDPYTPTDVTLFVSLVKNLSLMINQIRLKNQILQTQELELLGRMSRGMAHDLNNLLTPIWTLLQLVGEGASTQDLSEDLLPVALRNIKTMRAYIRESLFFSENLRPDFQLGRLDVLIAQAVDVTHARREAKSINILVDAPSEVLVEMDEVLIQRLIANLVANAIDASPPGSTIRLELVRLVKTEMNRDWLRVRIIDNGEGIKPENLNRVLTPYFTTKDRGDKERGFGLGLAICRKIVHLHGGNLNIASQLKKGTTVQVDLPSRQTKLPIPQPA